MSKIIYKFINDILKPWDELNKLLTEPYCVEPELSSITNKATNIAISLSHFAEVSQLMKRFEMCNDLQENQILVDIADMNKHHRLNKKERENSIHVGSMFEVLNEGRFQFLRNKITIIHNSYGEHDFMEITLKSIEYWVEKLSYETFDGRRILSSTQKASEKATLIFNPEYCIHAESSRCFFVKRNENDELIAYDPLEFYIEILDIDGKVKAYANITNKPFFHILKYINRELLKITM